LLERRETLHSFRLYEHLEAANGTTSAALAFFSCFLQANSGASLADAELRSLGLLARQVEVLSYADCFLFAAIVAVLALPFVLLIESPASVKK
jgi:DHA2 family multidrug resistance protein